MSRRRRRGPTPPRTGRRARRGGGGWGAGLLGLLVVAAMVAAGYGGAVLAAATARAWGLADTADAVLAPLLIGGVALGGVGTLFLVLAVAGAVRGRRAPVRVREREVPGTRGLRHDLRAAGRDVDDLTAPTDDPQTADRNRVVLLATLCAALAPALVLVLVALLLAALEPVLPDLLLTLVSLVLSLGALVFSGPVAYQLVSGRAVDEHPGGLPVPGIRRLRRPGRPFPRPPAS